MEQGARGKEQEDSSMFNSKFKIQNSKSKGQEDSSMLNAQCSMFNGLKKGIYIVNGRKVVF